MNDGDDAGGVESLAVAPGKPDQRFRILNWIGIINQLATTRANQILQDTDLPLPQFIVLNHFSHRPDEGKTVTRIAAALQQPQPGITKTVRKLLNKAYLRAQPCPEDGRVKWLYLTPRGVAAHQTALAKLSAPTARVFEQWQAQEIEELFRLLDRIKVYLDENR